MPRLRGHLGDAIPGASHINHMPAHVWTRIGRWGDAVDASLRAWQSDQKAAKGTGVMTYPAHDLHMLTFAASMDGQRAVALQAARGLRASPAIRCCCRWCSCGLASSTKWPRWVNGRRRHLRWDVGFRAGIRGVAPRRSSAAAAALDRLRQLARTSNAAFRIHPAKTLLGTVAAILEGEIQRAGGNAGAAIAAFERAVSLQDTLLVDDPEPLPLAARHWLGAALLDQRRFADAERVYREDLVRHPHNGWALTGLRAGAAGAGKAHGRRRRGAPYELGARRCRSLVAVLSDVNSLNQV